VCVCGCMCVCVCVCSWDTMGLVRGGVELKMGLSRHAVLLKVGGGVWGVCSADDDG
jgi:hypothetical protein